MSTPLIPCEIWMLETFSSLQYFGEMRDAWRTMLDGIETAYEQYMRKLPADYRSRPMSEQPDIGWGMRVIPNFRDTMQGLDDAYVQLSRGDLQALRWGGGISSNLIGQSRDYPPYWMTEEQQAHFYKWSSEAGDRASPIADTIQGSWSRGNLMNDGLEEHYRIRFPAVWPSYRLNRSVQVKSGERITHSGIYLPEADDSCPQLLPVDDQWPAPDAPIGKDDFGHNTSEVPTVWTLVERINDGDAHAAENAALATTRLRCEAGQPCPQSGFWFTPAGKDSRRYFKAGDLMPEFKSDYGATIWQWADDQSDPKL